MKLSKRTRDHYAAHGENASYVVRHLGADTTTQISLRRGRESEGEAIQIAVEITDHHKSRSVSKFGHLSLDQATWDALVEFVKVNRTLEFPTMEQRLSDAP